MINADIDAIRNIKRTINYSQVEKLCKEISGSGLNYDFTIEYRKSVMVNKRLVAGYVASSAFDTMTEHGYYDAPATFRVLIPEHDPYGFKLCFVGKRAAKLNRKYFLREYLEDVFYYAIERQVSRDDGDDGRGDAKCQ